MGCLWWLILVFPPCSGIRFDRGFFRCFARYVIIIISDILNRVNEELSTTNPFIIVLPLDGMILLSRREVSARQDAMNYLVRVRGLLSGW